MAFNCYSEVMRTSGIDYGRLWIVLVTCLVLNLIDLLLTAYFFAHGEIEEANPLMSILIENDIRLFAAAKLFLVSSGVVYLWLTRDSAVSRYGAVVALAVYSGVMLKHTEVVIQVLFY